MESIEWIGQDLRTFLPEPVLPEREDWVKMYWNAWSLLVQNIGHGSAENGFTEEYIDAAFSGNIFQWDTCLIAQFANYGFKELPVHQSLDNFYKKQEADGYICREYRAGNGAALFAKGSADAVNPPLFSWAELKYFKISNDTERLHQVLPALISYYRWLVANRRNENGLYWSSPLGCGMDNTPRYAASWIDFSAQQALNSLCIAYIADALGSDRTAEEFYGEHDALCRKINSLMWDEEQGYYWDLDTANSFVCVKTIAPFWTLLAKVASPENADRLAEHLANPAEFWRPHVFPTLSADNQLYSFKGNYWRGSVWAPTNYAVIKGLSSYGKWKLAREASGNHLENMLRVYNETGTIWENYSAEYSSPGNIAKDNFVGFSGLGPISLLIEEILGFDIDAPENKITWRLYPSNVHGIRNLYFGDNRVSLLAKREHGDSYHLEISAKKTFTLITFIDKVKEKHTIPAGSSNFTIG